MVGMVMMVLSFLFAALMFVVGLVIKVISWTIARVLRLIALIIRAVNSWRETRAA